MPAFPHLNDQQLFTVEVSSSPFSDASVSRVSAIAAHVLLRIIPNTCSSQSQADSTRHKLTKSTYILGIGHSGTRIGLKRPDSLPAIHRSSITKHTQFALHLMFVLLSPFTNFDPTALLLPYPPRRQVIGVKAYWSDSIYCSTVCPTPDRDPRLFFPGRMFERSLWARKTMDAR